jgi:hypothetical protein
MRTVPATEATGKHVPYGAIGSGYYSDNTKGCYDVVERSRLLAERALAGVLDARAARRAPAAREPFTLADYGTADAGTSMPLLKHLVAKVRAAEPDTPIVVLYEDQASNDWNSVFARVHNRLVGAEPSFLADGARNVFAMASGESFLRQITPDATVDLGYSSTAFHWLTFAPDVDTSAPGGRALLATLSADERVRAAFAARAAMDWRTLLSHRARELKPGGALAVANFAIDERGRFLGHTEHARECMFGTLGRLWHELAVEGLITREECERTMFPIFYRTLAECLAPLEGGSSAQPLALACASAETDLVRCPYHARWLAEGGDAHTHARRFVPTTRTWSNSTFASALDATKRGGGEISQIVDKLFERYTCVVAAEPEAHAMDYVHAYLHLVKVG